jgi:hypothetical protein
MKNIIFLFLVLLLLVFFYLFKRPIASEQFNSIKDISFEQPLQSNYKIFNVSNCNYKDKLLLAFRLSNITRCSLNPDFNHENNQVKNYLLLSEVDHSNPYPQTYQKLFLPKDIHSLLADSPYASLIRKNKDIHWGVEDIRVMYDEPSDVLLLLGNLPVPHDYVQNIMYLALAKKTSNEWRIMHEVLLYPTFDSPYKNQKNWIPILQDKRLYFVYSLDPFVILSCNTSTGECDMIEHMERVHPYALYPNQFIRGSSQAIPYKKGWIALGHLTTEIGNKRQYKHFFFRFDPSFQNVEFSKLFCFEDSKRYCANIQFAMGLSYSDGMFCISYGENDCNAKMVYMSEEDVEQQFK